MAEAEPSPGYRCLMCTESYTGPRLLHCGHSFCCECLTKYIDAEYVTEDDRLYFPCPVCEAPMVHEDANADVSTWATSFPKNDLLDTPTAQSSDVHFCAQCLRGSESNAAVVTCKDCEEGLCKECRIQHERNKASFAHRLVSISGNVGQLPDLSVYEICHQHGRNPLEVYCIDHHAMCCSICVSVSHRQCNNVKPMKDVIKKTMSPNTTILNGLTKETKKLLSEYALGLATLSTEEQEISEEITNMIQKAKAILDDLKEIFLSDVSGEFKVCREQLLSQRKYINAFDINVKNSHILLTRADQQLSKRHQFILGEQTRNQLSGHHRRMKQNTKKVPKFDIQLKLEATLDQIMKMTRVGTIKVTSTFSSDKSDDSMGSLIESLLPVASVSAMDDSTSTSDLAGSLQHLTIPVTPVTIAVDVWTGSVSCVHTVNARTLRGVERPWLTGGIFTENNELLFTDYFNKRLLLFDEKYSFLNEYKVTGKPAGIARGRTADEIFVALDHNPILRCTIRNNQLSEVSRISTPPGTWGIAVLRNNVLVSTYSSVEVMSVNGTVTKSIPKQTEEYNTCLAVSTVNSTVYYRDKDDVVCRRLDSDTVVYRYRDRGLRYPTGIGLDRDHNVYVCGYSSRNVHLISPDGSRGRVLLPKLSGITKPYSIVVHPTKQEFVVTSHLESTALEVYKFSDDNM